MEQTHLLLKHLDAPVRFLSFSMNDLIAYLAPLFVGALLDSMFVVPVVGIFLVMMAKKIVKKFPKFYSIRGLYWSLPTQYFNRIARTKLPPSNKRMWIK